jgi:hypothetical protein
MKDEIRQAVDEFDPAKIDLANSSGRDFDKIMRIVNNSQKLYRVFSYWVKKANPKVDHPSVTRYLNFGKPG